MKKDKSQAKIKELIYAVNLALLVFEIFKLPMPKTRIVLKRALKNAEVSK